MNRITLFVLYFIFLSVNSTPIQNESWDEKVLSDVQKVIDAHSKKTDEIINRFDEQGNTQITWQVSQNNHPETERPRPPQLDTSISNLLGVVDRLTMENANAVSNQEALSSSYLSKKSEIQSKLAVPLQQLKKRLEERKLCDKEEKAMSGLNEIVTIGLNREKQISEMREIQSNHYKQMTSGMKTLTEGNQKTLSNIIHLINQESSTSKQNDGSAQFDPVSLRQRQPEDMLKHAKDLSLNLANILQQKMEQQNEALVQISKVFTCSECDVKSKRLMEISGSIKLSQELKITQCQNLAESHRILDEADREKSIALQKELKDLETAHHLREEAEKSLKAQRDQSEHVAKKMVGFYQNLPAISSP